MRYLRYASVVVFLALIVLLAPSLVHAEDYITDAANALQQSPVYVAPGTPGTNNDTAGKLQGLLNSDDNIVLVVLPAEAENGTDIDSLVRELSEKLENKRIIGMSVGKKVVGYAPSLPTGVAADQMQRASSVSNEQLTALGTFARNIHIWQNAHPQPTPSILETPKKGGISLFVLLLLVLSAVASALLLIGAIKRSNSESQAERTRFKAPDQVKELLASIAMERLNVHDGELRDTLYQLCLDIEKYFKSSSNDKRKDSLFFSERLNEVLEVLHKYIDVQENPRYYYKPQEELRRGKESLIDFYAYVLDSIRRGNDADLIDYKVNTNTLQAQRYR